MEQWACQRCTLLNPISKNKCEVCEGPKSLTYPTIPDNLPIPEIDLRGLSEVTPHTSYEEEEGGDLINFDEEAIILPELPVQSVNKTPQEAGAATSIIVSINPESNFMTMNSQRFQDNVSNFTDADLSQTPEKNLSGNAEIKILNGCQRLNESFTALEDMDTDTNSIPTSSGCGQKTTVLTNHLETLVKSVNSEDMDIYSAADDLNVNKIKLVKFSTKDNNIIKSSAITSRTSADIACSNNITTPVVRMSSDDYEHMELVEDYFSEENMTVDPERSEEGSLSDQDTSWQCKQCTLKNSSTFSNCRTCHAPKPKQISASSYQPSEGTSNYQDTPSSSNNRVTPNSFRWSCSKCTFENGAEARTCVMCDAPHPQENVRNTSLFSPEEQIAAQSATSQQRNSIHNGEVHIGIATSSHQQNVEPPTNQNSPNSRFVTAYARSESKAFIPDWECVGCHTSNDPESNECKRCRKRCPQGSITNFGSLRQEYGQQTVSEQGSSGQTTVTTSITDSTNLETSASFLGHYQESARMEEQRKEDERKAIEAVERIKIFCQGPDNKFVDDSFRPNIDALFFPTSSSRNDNCEWLRPNQIKPDESASTQWTVFESNPQPSDIKQGILGNCWFLSGLAVLAERPRLLKQVMVTKEINEAGVYVVRLCKWGVWHTVIIDDLLPCDHHKKLIYSQSRRRQLWVPFIEKALAKLHGCYESLQAGRSLEGLATLTGAPCESLPFHKSRTDRNAANIDSDMIWVKLLSSMEAGFLMGASCGGGNMEVNETEYHEQGLRPRHAYSVLDVRAPRTFDNNVVRLIQLRNPWGQYSWKGAWSDRSIQWEENPALSNELLPYRSNDGTFWMDLEDMMKYFDCVDICKVYGQDWVEVRVQGEFPDSAAQPLHGFYLTVYERSQLEFSLFQQVSRTQEGSDRHPVDTCICVYRADKSENNRKCSLGRLVACGRRQTKKHLSCSCFLDPGNYLVVCLAFNHWLSGFLGEQGLRFSAVDTVLPRYVLVLHSSRPITLDYTARVDALLADAVIQLALKEGEENNIRDGVACYQLTKGWAGLIIVVENRHPNSVLQVKCDCGESSNVVSTRGNLNTKDAVPPLHRQVLMVLSQLDFFSGFTINHKLTHRMTKNDQRTNLGDWAAENIKHVPALDANVKGLHRPRPL